MGTDLGRVQHLTQLFRDLTDDPPQDRDTGGCESCEVDDFYCFVHESLLLGR